jgi:hypothetical protein
MQPTITEEQKRRAEAVGLVHFYKLRAARASIVFWVVIAVSGAIGTYVWSWVAIPLSVLAGIVWGSLVSYRTSKMIEHRTGLTAIEQLEAWRNPVNFISGD